MSMRRICEHIMIGAACLAVGIVIGGFVRRPSVSTPPQRVINLQSATRTKPRPPAPPAQADHDAEYRKAADKITIPYDANSHRSRLSAALCYQRLAAGMPVGTISDLRIAKAILAWGRSLGTIARLEYANRCLSSANDICGGRQPRPKRLVNLLGPLALYATAWNLTYAPKIAALFYSESDRQHSIAMAEHAGKVAQMPGPPCVWPVNPTIGAKYSQPLADTPPAAPRRRLLYNWRQLHVRPLKPVPDPR